VSERWQVAHDTDRRGRSRWRVLDGDDRSRPVAEFDAEGPARAHAARLAEGPFDLDEQEAWQDEDDDEDEAAEDGDDWPSSPW
jgi:hypothetical protein